MQVRAAGIDAVRSAVQTGELDASGETCGEPQLHCGRMFACHAPTFKPLPLPAFLQTSSPF